MVLEDDNFAKYGRGFFGVFGFFKGDWGSLGVF